MTTLPTVPDRARTVYLDLRDTAVRFSASFAVDQAGWARAPGPAAATAVVADRVADRPDAPPVDVLVVAPHPAVSRRALDAFTGGRARSVVSSTDPQSLPGALEASRRGLSIVSSAIVEAAHRFPALTPRQERTLALVVRGRQNRDIAREIGRSEATAKRDVADLLRRFDAPNRVALAATALRLGWSAEPRPWGPAGPGMLQG